MCIVDSVNTPGRKPHKKTAFKTNYIGQLELDLLTYLNILKAIPVYLKETCYWGLPWIQSSV